MKCRLIFYSKPFVDCWIWNGKFNQDGYGRINIDGKEVRAHRASYEIFHGSFDKAKSILHSCHNIACINPDHLRVGTNIDNMKDMVDAGRSCRGSNHSRAKLKESDIPKIKELGKVGFTQSRIATLFNVSQVNVGLILRNKNWKHV